MFAVNARREGWKNGHTFFVLSKTVPGLPVAVNRRYLVESVLGSLATAGATAATSKAAETVGQTVAETILGKDDSEASKEAVKGSYASIAEILRTAAKKIEELDEKRGRDEILEKLAEHHSEMGKLLTALHKRNEEPEQNDKEKK